MSQRLGFRADARMAGALAGADQRRAGAGEWFLRRVSALLIVVAVVLVGAGGRLMAAYSFIFPAICGGLLLFGLAYGLRPRLGRVRPLIEDTYVLTESERPAFFGLLRQVAQAAGTRMPDVVVLSDDQDPAPPWSGSAAAGS